MTEYVTSLVDYAQIVTAIVSLMIAVMAFCYSRKLGEWQRKHDKVSVTPILVMNTKLDWQDPKNAKLQVEIKNVGLGPALFKGYELSYDGQSTKFQPLAAKLIEKDHHRYSEDYLRYSYGWDAETEFGIPPGSSLEVANYGFMLDKDFTLEALLKNIGAVEFSMKYYSMYKDGEEKLSHSGKELTERFFRREA